MKRISAEFRNGPFKGTVSLLVVNGNHAPSRSPSYILKVRESDGKGKERKRKLTFNRAAVNTLAFLAGMVEAARERGPRPCRMSAGYTGGLMEAVVVLFPSRNGAEREHTLKVRLIDHRADGRKETLVLFEKGMDALAKVMKDLRESIDGRS